MTRDISVLGPLNIDLLIVGEGPKELSDLPSWDGPAEMTMTAAGSVGYTVGDLAKLGLGVRVVSNVPDDPLGLFIIDSLKRDGVDISGIQKIPDTEAGIGVYMLLFGSRKRPLVYRLPTHSAWPEEYSETAVNKLLDARILHCGGLLHFKDLWCGVTTEIFREAKNRGITTTLDPQFPLFIMEPPWMRAMGDILPYVDILFCDETEARNITDRESLPECAEMLLDSGPGTVIIKQGAEGAGIYMNGQGYFQKAVHLGDLVDSIGAGDAFDAGFLYATLQDWPLEKRLLFSCVAAGFTVTGVGGTDTFPTIEEIESVMVKYS
ncbi:MAG: sugar kinase [Anaerolineales bacterium]|nr:sugar kinase [Anaerolineales bacterium]